MDDPKKWRGFARALSREWKRNKLTDAAAALTFYGILALFPFVLFIARLAELTSRPRVGVLTFSALAAVVSSTTGVASLVTALNSAYGVSERRPQRKVYTMAFAVMLGASLLALLAAVVAVVAPIAAKQSGTSWQPLVGWLRLPFATFVMMIVWATIYYVLPDVPQTVRSIMPGAVAGVLVWLSATLGFSFYVSQFGTFGITYGALGGIVILLVWMWFSSLALMLGAEINAVLRHPPR
jgi:membrane protein